MNNFRKNNSILLLIFITIISISTFTSCEKDKLQENNLENQQIDASVEKSSAESTIRNVAADLNADLKIDPEVTESNAYVIESEQELRDFIIDKQRQIRNNPGYESQSCADGVYTGTGLSSGFADLNFGVSVTDGCISGISGGFSGWTLGVSYSQGATQFGCTSGTVCGEVNYNLIFENVGTVYSETICYSVSLNC